MGRTVDSSDASRQDELINRPSKALGSKISGEDQADLAVRRLLGPGNASLPDPAKNIDVSRPKRRPAQMSWKKTLVGDKAANRRQAEPDPRAFAAADSYSQAQPTSSAAAPQRRYPNGKYKSDISHHGEKRLRPEPSGSYGSRVKDLEEGTHDKASVSASADCRLGHHQLAAEDDQAPPRGSLMRTADGRIEREAAGRRRRHRQARYGRPVRQGLHRRPFPDSAASCRRSAHLAPTDKEHILSLAEIYSPERTAVRDLFQERADGHRPAGLLAFIRRRSAWSIEVMRPDGRQCRTHGQISSKLQRSQFTPITRLDTIQYNHHPAWRRRQCWRRGWKISVKVMNY